MDLSRSLIKEFADIVNEPAKSATDSDSYARGTARVQGDKKYVQIDGSDQLTPILETVDVQEGDRVLVTIKNHTATIMGNFTFPPSARKEEEALDKAEQAGGTANEASEKAQSALEQAGEASTNASAASALAGEAKEEAAAAQTAADEAKQQAQTAKDTADSANTKAEEAQQKAQESFEASSSAQNEIDKINLDVIGVKEDVADTLTELGELSKETETIKETMEVDYAKKTELSSVEASLKTEISKSVSQLQTTISQEYAAKTEITALEGRLQTQITQNADSISSQVTKIEKIESDTAAAQVAVDEAKKAAAAAQADATTAKNNAAAAQTAADNAAAAAATADQKAQAAQNTADEATKAVEAADAALAAAKTDLDEAKKNLVNVTSRVDATEEEIAAAQTAVSEAQANVNKALEDVAEAQYTASQANQAATEAKQEATTAKGEAQAAQSKADAAQQVADNAQAAADKAQADVAALTKRVTTAETNINQNAEQISLTATKVEEIGDTLVNDYYSKTQTDAAIDVAADQIKQEVTETVYTKTETDALVDGIQVGGRNLILDSDFSELEVENEKITVNPSDNMITFTNDTLGESLSAPLELSGYALRNLKGADVVLSGEYKINSPITKGDDTTDPVTAIGYEMGLCFGDPETPGKQWINWNLISEDLSAETDWIKYVVLGKVSNNLGELISDLCKLTLMFRDCTGSISFRNLKIEIGTKATDWTPAPEDGTNDLNNAIAETTQEITEQYTALINQTADQISLMVQELETITNEQSTTISGISNQLQITSEMAQFIKTTTEQLQEAVDGKLTASEVQEWARFDGATLELGASNQPFKARLSTTELAFYQGENKVAWISNNELHVLTAVIATSIGCGDFTFVDEGDLGFSLL